MSGKDFCNVHGNELRVFIVATCNLAFDDPYDDFPAREIRFFSLAFTIDETVDIALQISANFVTGVLTN